MLFVGKVLMVSVCGKPFPSRKIGQRFLPEELLMNVNASLNSIDQICYTGN